MDANIRLYPWFQFARSLLFWQATWFLFFQDRLSPGEAILLYAVYDIATTALEVPSGYLSDRIGRRVTLLLAAVAGLVGAVLLAAGGGFWAFALAQAVLGAGAAFASGTDSALLYESLARTGRAGETAAHELRAWRYQFTALAVSALTGGLMAAWSPVLPFAATAVAAAAALALAVRFREPPHVLDALPDAGGVRGIAGALGHPVLAWCFVLALSMYAFSHVPFVFGQPFILAALAAEGLSAEAPAVSGGVSAAMMAVSVAVSWAAPGLRRALGLAGILLAALAMQVALIGALAASAEVAVIGLLVLRMVPDSLAKPFLLATIQPLVGDRLRATYLSLQSFVGRLALAGSLIALSAETAGDAPMAHGEIRAILVWYLAAGLAVWVGLALTARAVRG